MVSVYVLYHPLEIPIRVAKNMLFFTILAQVWPQLVVELYT